MTLGKGVYPYEYMGNCEWFDKTKILSKEKFYSSLNIEDIYDADYKHAIIAWKGFEFGWVSWVYMRKVTHY